MSGTDQARANTSTTENKEVVDISKGPFVRSAAPQFPNVMTDDAKPSATTERRATSKAEVMMTDHDAHSRRTILALLTAVPAIAMTTPAKAAASASRSEPSTTVHYKTSKVGDVEVFYREAGPANAPVILLLHGFPTSSHMFRDLIPELAGDYRVIAPDLPGFGQTEAPPRSTFTYSFDALADVIEGFVDAIGLSRYAIYIFDYGAPTGLRLAMRHPERVTAIITQNGNAYVEGFSKDWAPWQAYWREPTLEHREATRASLTDEAIRFQHEHGAPPGSVAPDGYLLDTLFMHRPEAQEIQLDLILSYRTNVALYPRFQEYLRTQRPPVLAVWGRHDAFFLPPGAQAYRRDVPDAEVHLLDAGHFALETHHRQIAALMRDFLGRKLKP